MHDDAITDIRNALCELRAAFRKHNIPQPDQFSYSDPDLARAARMSLFSQAARTELMSYRIASLAANGPLTIVGFEFDFTGRSKSDG